MGGEADAAETALALAPFLQGPLIMAIGPPCTTIHIDLIGCVLDSSSSVVLAKTAKGIRLTEIELFGNFFATVALSCRRGLIRPSFCIKLLTRPSVKYCV